MKALARTCQFHKSFIYQIYRLSLKWKSVSVISTIRLNFSLVLEVISILHMDHHCKHILFSNLKLSKINLYADILRNILPFPKTVEVRVMLVELTYRLKAVLTRDNLQRRFFAQQCCAKNRTPCNMALRMIFRATFGSATRCEFLI